MAGRLDVPAAAGNGLQVQVLARPYSQTIGLSRYTRSLFRALEQTGLEWRRASPRFPWPVRAAHRLLAPFGFDVRAFFLTFPVSAEFERGVLAHLPAQQMAALLWFQPRLHPAIVTVHDIVPFLVRRDRVQSTFRHPADVLFDRLAMEGLKRADGLISDSEFTRRTLVEYLDCDAEKIYVVPLGVDHEVFHPGVPDPTFYARYDLETGCRYLLYVGSENPRKNLSRLLEAFGEVHRSCPEARLVKIGSAEYQPQAQALRRQVREAGLEGAVIFREHVPDEDLVLFYNLAEVFVFPSLYEGFGLPPLEAMACGTPVVCSNAASLPEVVGEAALLVDPYDTPALADALLAVLSNGELRRELREKGLHRAAQFTWERTAQETIRVYEKVLNGA